MATRCCWPPESWMGSGRAGRPGPPLQRLPAPARIRSAAVHAGVEQRQLHVLQRRWCAESRLNPWKTKPILRLRMSASSSLLRPETSMPSSKYWPLRGLVQAAEDVHQGGLAGARGAHDGDELAPGYRRRCRAGRARPPCPVVHLVHPFKANNHPVSGEADPGFVSHYLNLLQFSFWITVLFMPLPVRRPAGARRRGRAPAAGRLSPRSPAAHRAHGRQGRARSRRVAALPGRCRR